MHFCSYTSIHRKRGRRQTDVRTQKKGHTCTRHITHRLPARRTKSPARPQSTMPHFPKAFLSAKGNSPRHRRRRRRRCPYLDSAGIDDADGRGHDRHSLPFPRSSRPLPLGIPTIRKRRTMATAMVRVVVVAVRHPSACVCRRCRHRRCRCRWPRRGHRSSSPPSASVSPACGTTIFYFYVKRLQE